jgi:sporulation protein YlmC with PRC-barrel domain
MKIFFSRLLVVGVVTLCALSPARAQVAGSTSVGVVVAELDELVMSGWSTKKSLLGKAVFNERNEKIGNVEDLIISLDKQVSYVIIGAGGFIGMGRHDVAVPFSQISELDGRLLFPKASKDSIKAMPTFIYATDTAKRQRFVDAVERDVAIARGKVRDLETKLLTLSGEAKVKVNQQIEVLKEDLKIVEDKLSELKKAGASRWKEFAIDLRAALKKL